MQPSSLIFLVIIGIWAAYFVQYWVRRREHLATIRSVDAFSETMRVLERRSPLPSLDAGSQAPRTYAVSPARAMRPQVTVKRAEAHTMSRVEVPAARPTASSSTSGHAGSSTSTSAASRVVGTEVAPMQPSRAVRGISLLAGVLGTVVVTVLAVLGVVVAWAPFLPLVMALGSFAWLRAGVQSEIRARQELSREARQQARRDAQRRTPVAARTAGDPAATAVPARRPAPVVESEVVVADAGDDADPDAVDAPDDATPEAAPFDVSAEAATGHAAGPVAQTPGAAPAEPVATPAVARPAAEVTSVLPEVDEDDIPLTWDPRPVPPPTYTMKARAPERLMPTAQVEVLAEAEEPAYDELPQRRISGL